MQEIESTNKSDLLFFTNKCNVYKIKAYEIEDCKASQYGIYLPNILDLEADESIMYMHATLDYSGSILFAFESGKIARVPLNTYETKTNRKKLVKAYYGKSLCVGMSVIHEEGYIECIRTDEKGAIIPTHLIEEKNKRDTPGVQVLKLTQKHDMAHMQLLKEIDENIEKLVSKTLPAHVKTMGIIKDQDSN